MSLQFELFMMSTTLFYKYFTGLGEYDFIVVGAGSAGLYQNENKSTAFIQTNSKILITIFLST